MKNKKLVYLCILILLLTVTLTANPISGNLPLNVQFTANAQDSDGNIVKYEWDFFIE